MSEIKGQSRVVIENVQPQVDGGQYPAKFTVGEFVNVSADIFSDGHDHIRAHVLFRKETSESWSTLELKHQVNDSWAASFQVTEKGFYFFTVRAWVDHLETWYDGFWPLDHCAHISHAHGVRKPAKLCSIRASSYWMRIE